MRPRKRGIPECWAVWVAVLILGLVTPGSAQPPERFRLDLSGSSFSQGGRGFLGGDFAPRAGLVGPTDILALFELTGTVNVTEQLSLIVGVPFGFVEQFRSTPGTIESLFEEGDIKFGIGDIHVGASYPVLREGPSFPGISLGVEIGTPTAKFAGLGTGLWRVTGSARVSKALSARFSVFASGSYSHFFEKENVDPGPITAYGGGVVIGVTSAHLLTIQIEEVTGGKIEENGLVVAPFTRDLRAGLGLTLFSKGRPRHTFGIAAGGLRDKPTFLTTWSFALWSL